MYTPEEYHFEDEKPLISESYLLNPIIKILEKKKPKNILDVGCGNGSIANHLIKMGYNTYGLDISKSGIESANKVNPGHFFYCNFEKNELPKELPLKEFDFIISTEVIEHLYAPNAFMSFCKFALKKDGEMLISTPYHGYLKNLTLALSNKMDDHFNVNWEGGHIKFWSKKTLEILYIINGFTPLEFKGCGRFPYLWKSMIMTGKPNA